MRTSVALYIYVGVSVKNIRGEWQPEIHVTFTYAYHTLKQQAHYVITSQKTSVLHVNW